MLKNLDKNFAWMYFCKEGNFDNFAQSYFCEW